MWHRTTAGIFGTVVMGNRFESNLGSKKATGIYVADGVRSTRILFNTFEQDRIVPVVMDAEIQFATQIGFNASAVPDDEVLVALGGE
jgi:hypothetical protein